MTGGFLIDSGGDVLTLPLGVSLSANYFWAGAFGAACGTAVATTIVAGDTIYLIPWETLWKYVKDISWSILDRTGDGLKWLWGGIIAAVMRFVSTVTARFPSFSLSGPRVHSS